VVAARHQHVRISCRHGSPVAAKPGCSLGGTGGVHGFGRSDRDMKEVVAYAGLVIR